MYRHGESFCTRFESVRVYAYQAVIIKKITERIENGYIHGRQ